MSMPSYWYDPMVGGGASIGAAQGAAVDASIKADMARQQQQMAQWNTYDPWANTPGGFGAQTAYYQQQAANSYGNINSATLSPSSVGYSSPAPAPQPQHNVFDYGTSAFNPYGGMGGNQTFDPGKYYQQNPDVFSSGTDAWTHYNQFGKNEGRQGTWADSFNSSNYLANNPDVYASGMDPTQHWFQYGSKEGRTGGGGENPFNAQEYLLENRDVAAAGADPYQHWLNYGSKEGRQGTYGATEDADWSKYFSGANTGRDQLAAEYFMANRDVYDAARSSGQDPTKFGLEHLKTYGQDEGRKFFDEQGYLEQNPDVWAAGTDPFEHYQQFGQAEGRAMPTGEFLPWEYYMANPDVANANVDAFQHYVDYGQNEGRNGGWEWSSRNKGKTYDMLAPSAAMEGFDAQLANQRASYVQSLRNDPAKLRAMANIVYRELKGDSAGRTGITEAMLNRYFSRQLDPLDPKYYPQRKAEYNATAARELDNNPELLAQVYRDMDRAFAGSNVSNYATDWASGDYAKNYSRPNQTATWTSQANEEFFRKDINNADTGPGAAKQIQEWYKGMTGYVPTPTPRP